VGRQQAPATLSTADNVKRLTTVAAPLVTAAAVAWALVATGASPGSTPAAVRLAVYGNGRLIRALTASVCGNDESCPAYAFPPIPPGAPHLTVGDVLLVRVTGTVQLITVTARAPMRGIPGNQAAHAPPAPAAPRSVTLARRRATNTVRVRLPRGIAGTEWLVLTLSYAAGAATVPVPVQVST
jgi:hypothetical protein